ncbi:hypothetical protein [Acholeplasma hippikon]|uniref:Uncharacterized protein n=1 Tax=Acholeplasma hippikon TaxID=264636 RepID=A0A449BJ73_9MOLU|nr:hypothetical protein [Acholeplasma hippikon]VEU82480.1 Uncharacterised protein [Acholeplasma hippikon]
MSTKDKLLVIREAVENRLKEVYKKDEFSKEAGLLEYIMCVIEADDNTVDFAKECLFKMYE